MTIEIRPAESPSAGKTLAQRLEEWTSILDGLINHQLGVSDRLLAARPSRTGNGSSACSEQAAFYG